MDTLTGLETTYADVTSETKRHCGSRETERRLKAQPTKPETCGKSKELRAKTVSAGRRIVRRVKEKTAMNESEALRLANGLPVAVSARENLDELTRSTKSRDTIKATSNRTRTRKQNPEKLVRQ